MDGYFQRELATLNELGVEFARSYPALAPRLVGPLAEPDGERLLEGVAFQTALLRRRMGDYYPEMVHDLMRLVLPHYPLPVPATTIIAFSPEASLERPSTIPRGARLDSVMVDGTSCRFATGRDVEVYPFTLSDAVLLRTMGQTTEIRLSFDASSLPVSRCDVTSLRLFLSDSHVSAADLYLLLSRYVKRIVVTPGSGGTAAVLPARCLKPVGFSPDSLLSLHPAHAFPGYQLLREYFTAPEIFLFFDLTGWELWRDRGGGTEFTVGIELENLPFDPPRIRRESFSLFAVPASNIFTHDADPICLDHRASRHLVRPSGMKSSHYQVCTIDKVTGISRKTGRERRYDQFELFRGSKSDAPVYHQEVAYSPLRNGFDVYLSVAYPEGVERLDEETLSMELSCTNGSLPGSLRIGDIRVPTSGTPEGVSFRNITSVNPGSSPRPDRWGDGLLTSHLSLNLLSLTSAERLRSLLEMYLVPGSQPDTREAANRKRIEGIEEVSVKQGDLLRGDVMLRGLDIMLKVRQDHFAGPGDLYLFGCVLDRFLGGYASLNTFTRLTMVEVLRGATCRWPARLGNDLIP